MRAALSKVPAYATILVILIALLFLAEVVASWTGPSASPPNDNVPAPVNVGTIDQIKDAGLGLNSLAVFGNAILNGTSRYLNFGSTVGEEGYGIRDNNGVIECKNEGGSWTPCGGDGGGGEENPGEPLYGGEHTHQDCISLGGQVRSTSSGDLCELYGGICPFGWTRLDNWGSTISDRCVGQCSSCTTGSHAFANEATERCSYRGRTVDELGICDISSCSADTVTVGCY